MTAIITPVRPAARTGAKLPLPSRNALTAGALLLALLAVGLWSLSGVGLSWQQIARGVDYAGSFLARAVPFVWPSIPEILWLSALTLAIVFCGTAMAAIISIPVAYLAARNTTPTRLGGALGRFLGVATRAAPDAIMAMIFAMVIGQGALAGVLALGIHSVGMISKLTADAIEQVPDGPRLALRAAGATKSQEFWGAVWPQVLPAFIAIVLHRADINLRVSVILGFVGVAGLGQQLSIAMQTLNYRDALPFAIIIFVLCVAFEIVSALIRRFLLGAPVARRTLAHRFVRALPGAEAGAGQNAGPSGQSATKGRSLGRAAGAGRVPWTADRLKSSALVWGTATLIGVSIALAATQESSFANFWKNLGIAAARLWPPALPPEKWEATAVALTETVQIAFAATLLALVGSMILGVFSARNVAPNPAVRGASRFALVVIRGLPELLLALFFIILTGLGPGAAVLALAIGGVGLLGKLFADSIEEVDRGPEGALKAVGATRTQVFTAATFPQATPALVGHTLYLLDTNIRSATVLGIVGGGGIGYMLSSAARINQHELLALLLCVLVIVFAVEGLASWLRRLIA